MQLRTDAHMHLWELARGDYDWLDPENANLATIARDFSIQDAIVNFTKNGIKGCVLVQAAATEAETDYMLGLAEQHEVIRGVVGWVDLSSDASVASVERFSQNAKFKGVRPMLQDLADNDWIATAPNPKVIEALITKGLRFDALVLPQHLSALLKFAQSYPDLPIVIDHAAKPAFAADESDPRHEMWRDGMMRLAAETTANCKVSGLLTELSPSQRLQPEKRLQPTFDALLEWFGPERLMWGSDWPVLNLASSYSDWTKLSETIFQGLDAEAQNLILDTNATRFYALEDEG